MKLNLLALNTIQSRENIIRIHGMLTTVYLDGDESDECLNAVSSFVDGGAAWCDVDEGTLTSRTMVTLSRACRRLLVHGVDAMVWCRNTC